MLPISSEQRATGGSPIANNFESRHSLPILPSPTIDLTGIAPAHHAAVREFLTTIAADPRPLTTTALNNLVLDWARAHHLSRSSAQYVFNQAWRQLPANQPLLRKPGTRLFVGPRTFILASALDSVPAAAKALGLAYDLLEPVILIADEQTYQGERIWGLVQLARHIDTLPALSVIEAQTLWYQTEFPPCPTCGKPLLEHAESWECGAGHRFSKLDYQTQPGERAKTYSLVPIEPPAPSAPAEPLTQTQAEESPVWG
jgi:hypothetical protein